MTANGDVPSGAGGVNEPDWIDQILERATLQVDSLAAERKGGPVPVVPQPTPIVATTPPVAPVEPVLPIEPVLPVEPVKNVVPVQPAEPAQSMVPADPIAPPPVEPIAPSLPVEPVKSRVERAKDTTDQLAEIRWAEEPHVTPASTPVVRTDGAGLSNGGAPGTQPLTAKDVGRSAWDAELASVGDEDPEGWEKLSWQDLDGPAEQPRELHEASSFSQAFREWAPVLFAAVAIALFIRLVIVQAYHIPSPSMVPTLENGDRVVVNRLSYRFGEIDRGQVVVFKKPANTEGENDLIKRVLALPGETIRFVDNQVYIDGLRLEEPYLLRPDSTQPRSNAIPGCAQATAERDLCEVPAGYVFVMGDNREGSSDSRVFGPVPTESIVGRAFLRVWPLNNIGQL